jgi:formamidopyrimidine-DNA glycosylase
VPELIEVEYSRRHAEGLVGRTVRAFELRDQHASAWDPATLAETFVASTVVATRRRGKLLLIDTDVATLGLHFGMTGRLVVDGVPTLERLLYSPVQLDERWLRLTVDFDGGQRLELHDARRLARVHLNPPEDSLGPDAATVTLAELRRVVGSRTRGVALKARLLDQSRLAGVGNLIADEVLWRAALSPERPAGSIDEKELHVLHRRLRATIALLLKRGGSHTGDLMAARVRGGVCPKDGAPLTRSTVGGRTTYWCPAHQR